MLIFVIPLRSVAASPDWAAVTATLERTLASATNQTSEAFQVIVVCHEQPELRRSFKRVSFLPVDFPVDGVTDPDLKKRLFAMRTDHGRKRLRGLEAARAFAGSHVMFLDADDLVSRRLAALVSENPEHPGWFVDRGYRWDLSCPWLVYPRRGFYRECGSSYIIRSDLAPFPDDRPDYTRDLNDYFIRRFVVHAWVREDMQKRGHELAPLPFPGAVYTFHPHNIYAATMRKESPLRTLARRVLKGRPFAGQLRREFLPGKAAPG